MADMVHYICKKIYPPPDSPSLIYNKICIITTDVHCNVIDIIFIR